MKNIVILFLIPFLLFACNQQQANLDADLLPDDRVEKRLQSLNKNLLKKGEHLKLDGSQITSLKSVIEKKIKALDAANLNEIHPRKKRKAVRDSIRNAWQGDIDNILRPDQRDIRKHGFAAPKKDKK